MNAGQIIGQTLKLYGVEYFFALTGGDQDIWFGLRDAGIKFILPHSERAGVAMADAYARLTGKPSFTYGQFGPGAALCVSGVADAYWGKSPVICITSSMSTRNIYRHTYQGIDDQQSLFAPITKWNVQIPNAARLPDILRSAIRTAVSGVPGPVHIDIPHDLTFYAKEDVAEPFLYAEPRCKKVSGYRVAPDPKDIERAVEVIAQSKKPLILAGGGVITSEAWEELIKFAENLSIPVVTSAAGKSAIASSHPLALGAVGSYSRKVTNDLVSICDTYIVIGSNLGDMTTRIGRLPRPSTKLIHIDLDPVVLGTNFKEEISIVADAKLAIKSLIEATDDSGLTKKTCPWTAWLQEVQSMMALWKASFQELAKNGGSPNAINPYFVMAALNKVISPKDVIVTDTGYMGAYGNSLIDVKAPGRKYLRTAGSLGWGFPALLGAQVAMEGQGRTFGIIGDGGIGYHIGEVETALRYNLPILALVMNNNSLGFEYHVQKIICKDVVPQVNDFLDIDYGAVAKAYGAHGEKVRKPEEVEGAIRRALDSGKPALIDFAIDKEVYAPVAYYEKFEKRLL